MKAQLGKPTGLALALLATLLATFLAMGIYTVAQADGHSADRSFSATEVAPDGAVITVTITLTEYDEPGVVRDALQGGFTLVDESVKVFSDSGRVSRGVIDNSAGQVAVVFNRADITRITYMVTPPSDAGDSDPPTFVGAFLDPTGEMVIGGDDMITVTAATTGVNGDGTDVVQPKATTKTTPGSNQSLTLEADVDFTSTDSITVNLEDFGVPSSIAPAQISMDVVGGDAESTTGTGANPSDVEVDGTKVTLVGPYETGGNNPVNLAAQGTSITKIVFRRAAGITLPIRDGDYDIKVSTLPHPRTRARVTEEKTW